MSSQDNLTADVDKAGDGGISYNPQWDAEKKKNKCMQPGVLFCILVCLLLTVGIYGALKAEADAKKPIRILFVGNSFTYGPGDYWAPERLHNLPEMYKKLGESLGIAIETGEDTIGGCTIATHRPEINPYTCYDDGGSCNIVNSKRTLEAGYGKQCSINSIMPETAWNHSSTYKPCPQLLRWEDWDYIVLQEHSAVPTVPAAAGTYTYPGFTSYKNYIQENIPTAKLVAYMTWSYYNGSYSPCPGKGRPGCFPQGWTYDFTPNCSDADSFYRNSVSDLSDDIPANIACMQYNVATSYMQTFNYGADMVAPVGLGWNIVRGAASKVPDSCKSVNDDIWQRPNLQSYPMDLPKFDDVSAIAKDDYGMIMFRDTGNWEKGLKYCSGNCTIDHHASSHGMYMSANVMLATTLGVSTKGASYRPVNVTKAQAELIQNVASELVLKNRKAWYPALKE